MELSEMTQQGNQVPRYDIVCDKFGKALAEKVAGLLAAVGHKSLITQRERFPIANGMTLFLAQLHAQESVPILIISDSKEAAQWLWPEIQNNQPLYSRMMVVISTVAASSCPHLQPLEAFILEARMSSSAWLEAIKNLS
jgi:hypothetical protein